MLPGSGGTRRGNIVHERSKMVLILAEQDSDALTRLDEIAEEYKRRFSQESVLRVCGLGVRGVLEGCLSHCTEEGILYCQLLNLLAVLHVLGVQSSATGFEGGGDNEGVVEAEAVAFAHIRGRVGRVRWMG